MWLGFTAEFWSFAIGIAGTALSLISFVFSLQERRRSRGGLSVGIHQSIGFAVEKIAAEFPKLTLLYDNKYLNGEVVWISGVIANSGGHDIGPCSDAGYPTIELAETAIWHDFLIGPVPEEWHARRTPVGASKIKVSWSLLKSGEVIPFRALIGTDDSEYASRLRNGHGLNVLARIENVHCRFEGEFSEHADIASLRGYVWGIIASALVTLFLFISASDGGAALTTGSRWVFALLGACTAMMIVYWLFQAHHRYRWYRFKKRDGRLLDIVWQ